MEKIKYSVIVKTRSKKDKSGIIKIQWCEKGDMKYHTLLAPLDVNEFDKKNQLVKDSHPEAKRLNELIKRELDKFIKKPSEPETEKMTFKRWSARCVDRQANEGTKKKYTTSFRKFEDFLLTEERMKDIELDKLTDRLMEDFVNYIRKDGNKESTLDRDVQVLKRMYNDAVKAKHIEQKSIFINIKFKVPKPKLVFLESDEITRVLALPDKYIKGTVKHQVSLIAKYQLFAQGTRISDSLLLKWDNIQPDDINFRMLKTGQEMKINLNKHLREVLIDVLYTYGFADVQYLELLKNYKTLLLQLSKEEIKQSASKIYDDDIINNYKIGLAQIFDKMMIIVRKNYRNKLVFNKFLKDKDFAKIGDLLTEHQAKEIGKKTALYNNYLQLHIQKDAGIEKHLSSKIFRNSFANLCLSIGIGYYEIQKMLNHHSIKVTETYLRRVDDRMTKKANNQVADLYGGYNKSKLIDL